MPCFKKQKTKKALLLRHEEGFTVLYAVLIIAAIVSIGTAVINTALREVRIAGTGDKSVRAQYAAESALECITYWMVQDADAFGGAAALTETCNGAAPQVETGSYNLDNRVAAYEYKATVDMGAAGCAYVYVDADTNILRADGFYPSCGSGAVTERSLIGTYATEAATAGEVITTNPNEPKCIDFTVSPSSVSSGGSATLTWSTQNANGVDIQPGIGSTTANGSVSVNPLVTTEYTLTTFSGPSARGEVCHVTAKVSSSPSLPTVGLLGWWKLEDAPGDLVVDSASSYVSGDVANNGTRVNALWSNVTYGARSGSSLLFAGNPPAGGISTYVDIPTSGAMRTLTQGTIAAWVKVGSRKVNSVIWANRPYGGTGGVYLAVGYQKVHIGIASRRVYSDDEVLPKNGWVFVAVTFQSKGTVKFYVNGLLVTTINIADSITASTANKLRIGSNTGTGSIFHGYVDDVWVYNRVLSDQEIADIYNYSVN